MDGADFTPDSPPSEPTRRPRLTSQQHEVYSELMRRDARWARMYLGAVLVLEQTTNPERFCLAAHALRELIDKLGDRLGGPIAVGPILNKKVGDLRGKWPSNGVPSRYDEPSPPLTWPKPVRDFLDEAGAFFRWWDEAPPSRRDQMGRVFAATDPQHRRLSPVIEQTHVQRWISVRKELLSLVHHGRDTTAPEFERLLDCLNGLLLDRLCPRTFENQAAIDLIIAEGESSP